MKTKKRRLLKLSKIFIQSNFKNLPALVRVPEPRIRFLAKTESSSLKISPKAWLIIYLLRTQRARREGRCWSDPRPSVANTFLRNIFCLVKAYVEYHLVLNNVKDQKCWPNFYSNLLYKMGQDFLGIQ